MSREAFAGAFDVSRETLAALEHYVALIGRWNPAINLVSRRSLDDVWTRHIADSAQLVDLVATPPARWTDLGSGGGLPAIVVAAIARGRGWPTRFVLVESDARKSAFLATAIRELGLAAEVVTARIEAVTLPPLADPAAEIISARALAPVGALLAHAERLNPQARLLLPKGRTAESELTEALRDWHVRANMRTSRTDPSARILDIGAFARRPTH